MKIAFTILGECRSMKNSRQIVSIGKGDAKRPAVIKSADARKYEKLAQLQIPFSARQMVEGPVKVTVRLFYSSQRPDLDESLLLDVLQAKFERDKTTGERRLVRKGVYVNDRQVREKHIFHGIDKGNPRAEIEIETLAPQQGDLVTEMPAEPELEVMPF